MGRAVVSQISAVFVDPSVTAWEARADSELLRSDSPQAFAVFYRRHLPWVLRWLGAKVRDREVAADLTGEVFAAALRGRHTFRDDASPAEPWLQSIARNVLVDSVRRRRVEDRARRELGIATLTLTDTDLERVDALIDQAQGAAPALQALSWLPATQSEAVRARGARRGGLRRDSRAPGVLGRGRAPAGEPRIEDASSTSGGRRMTDYFDHLEHELFAAAERKRDRLDTSPPETIKRPRGRRTAAAAIALTLLAGGTAAAVTGVFRPHRKADGLVRLSERRTVAEGTTSDGRRWQLTASQSGAGFCFGLRLPNPVPPGSDPGAYGTNDSEGCGGKQPGTLTLATSSGGTEPAASNALAFGTAPERARRVRVEARGISKTTATIEDDAGLDGRVYFVELPTRKALGPTTIVALDARGQEIGRTALG